LSAFGLVRGPLSGAAMISKGGPSSSRASARLVSWSSASTTSFTSNRRDQTVDDVRLTIKRANDRVDGKLVVGDARRATWRLAREGDARKYRLPRPLLGRPGCDFSFSGLKTAVRQAIEALGAKARRDDGGLERRVAADLAAGFQAAVADVLADRTRHALSAFRARYPRGRTLVAAGGVAANETLRKRLEATAGAAGFAFLAPPQKLCTDNGAMIAWAGIERLRLGLTDALDFAPRPRWPLDPNAPKAIGAGVKA